MPQSNEKLISSLSDEARLQYHLVTYIRLQYPSIIVHHNANGGKLSAAQGYVNNLLGQVKGFPDLTIIKKCKTLFLEVKTEKGTLSKAQREVIERLKNLNQNIKVCYGLTQGMKIVDEFIRKVD